MNFKDSFEKYKEAHEMANKANFEIDAFFSSLDLEYGATYCQGDGVMILNNVSALCAHINDDQITRLSRSKTRDDAMSVIAELFFGC